jgi:hypothetical protein
MRYLIIFFLISTFSIIPGSSQTDIDLTEVEGGGNEPPPLRSIIWVHGLGGDPFTTWSTVSTDLETKYHYKPHRFTYSETSMIAAGSYLLSAVNDMDIDEGSAPPFVVAHSQGGLVARQAAKWSFEQKLEPPIFQGLVTFGTPHQGAPLVANLDKVYEFIEEGCRALAIGPISDLLETNFILDLFIDEDKIAKKIADPLCSTLANQGVPLALKDLLKPTKDEYAPGTEFLTELNAFEDNLHKICFYGVEEDPVFYRLLKWLSNSPELPPPYQANEDEDLVRRMSEVQASYKEKAKSIWANIIRKSYFPFEPPEELLYNENSAWWKGAEWLAGVDDTWKILIGVAENERIVTEQTCTCYEYEYPYDIPRGSFTVRGVTSAQECYDYEDLDEGIECEYFEKYSYEYKEVEESDGVVPVSSASNCPGMITSVEMPESNHQQMRNDMNTEWAMREVFDGVIHDFFFTESK